MLSHQAAFLANSRDLLQYGLCAAGTLAVLAVVWTAFGLKRRWPDRRRAIDVAAYLSVGLLGCAMLFAPFGVLQGDGQIHQAKVAFLADAIRHGRLPEWTFLWFGGSDVSECYGPLYYVLEGALMAVFGLSSKLAFALTVFGCYAAILFAAPRALRTRYSETAAAIAAICFLLSPARAGLYWWDGRPHVIVIDFICAVYVLYLMSTQARSGGLRRGVALGLSASLCVTMHLQYGALATLLLFGYTALTTGLDDRLALAKQNLRGLAVTLAVAAALFAVFAIPHYAYYYAITPDMVASANSALDMFSLPADRWPTLLAEIEWGAWSGDWDAHYVGLVPLALSTYAVFRLFRRDRFAVVGGVFAIGLFASAILLRRDAAFLPIFYLPAVAGAIDAIRARLAERSPTSPPQAPAAAERRRALELAVILTVVLVDLAPSNFISPYRPGAGAKPLVAELKSERPSPGRTLVIGPSGGYSLLTLDEKRGQDELEIPSFFGPTSQLSTKIYGLSAAAARAAWLDHAQARALDPDLAGLLSLLDVSRVVFYGQRKDIQVLDLPTARPAWRIRSFVCDAAATPLAKISWDQGRSIGEGSTLPPSGWTSDLRIDAANGAVDGVHIDCAGRGLGPPAVGGVSDGVGPVIYDRGFENARFHLASQAGGLFLLPFGYYRDLKALADGRPVILYRTNDWMTVAEMPAGLSTVTIYSQSLFRIMIRYLDLILLLSGVGFTVVTLKRDRDLLRQ